MSKKSKSNVYEGPIKTPIKDKVSKTSKTQDTTSKPARKYISINSNRPPAPRTVPKDQKASKNKDTATTSSFTKSSPGMSSPKVRELNVKQSSDFLQGNDDFYDSMARFDNTAGFNTDFNKLNQDYSYYNNNTNNNQYPTSHFTTDNLTANPPNFNSNMYTNNLNSNNSHQFYQNPYQPNQTPKRYHF